MLIRKATAQSVSVWSRLNSLEKESRDSVDTRRVNIESSYARLCHLDRPRVVPPPPERLNRKIRSDTRRFSRNRRTCNYHGEDRFRTADFFGQESRPLWSTTFRTRLWPFHARRFANSRVRGLWELTHNVLFKVEGSLARLLDGNFGTVTRTVVQTKLISPFVCKISFLLNNKQVRPGFSLSEKGILQQK